jgi:hypothetical protein
MNIFTYVPDPENPFDKLTVSITTKGENLEDMCEAFERYLKATGFVFSGKIDIVEEEKV